MSITPDHPDSFFRSMRPLLWFGQLSGVFPIHGTTGSNHKVLRFSWYNWQLLFVTLIFVSTLFFNIVSTKDNLAREIRLDNFGSTIFYSVCNLNTIFFLELARKWPDLSESIFLLEQSMAEYGYPPLMAIKIKVFLVIFLALSIFEHGLLTYLNVLGASNAAAETGKSFLLCFFEYRFPVVLQNVVYSDFTVIFVFVVTVIGTFNWNYLDFFLSCLSIQIYSKLRQFNSRLEELAPSMTGNSSFWLKMCNDYNNLSILTKKFERIVSKLVFMSYISNFYHLSLQLLRSFKTMTVSLCGARIKEESLKAKHVLFKLKKPCLNSDRLLLQVIYDDICLTGKKFFYLNRRFIVTMIGTLITYEVILLQLNSIHYEV